LAVARGGCQCAFAHPEAPLVADIAPFSNHRPVFCCRIGKRLDLPRGTRALRMGTILTHPAATALWHDLVREAEQRGQARLDADLESYLVFLLMRHLRDAQLADHVLALDYLLALQRRGAQRGQELRDVGDRCLLIAGLYPHQAEQRLVSLDYFIALGANAYSELAAQARSAIAALYEQLAGAFARLVRVLVELRRLATADALSALSLHSLAIADPTAAARDFPGAMALAVGSTRPH
jgi:hypothetical protein